MDIPLVVWEQEHMVFELRNAHVPEVEMFAQVLEYFRLDSHLRLLDSNYLFQERLAELRLDLGCKRACKLDKIDKNFVEGFCQVLLICSLDKVPVLPEHLAEDFLSNIRVK